MIALERLAIKAGACALVAVAACAWHAHKVSAARQAGYDAAVMAGEKQRAADAAVALANERALRARLAAADAAAQSKEQTYAENLAAAQRRVRAGTDVLRCPAAAPVPPAAAAPDGSAAGGPAPDWSGAAVVPEVAGDILRLAADTGRVVRNYQRVVERLDACIALNNGPAADETKVE
ncbi:hypothetical protein [Massilia sp. METH4]|uniref:hypothetical protein n=1 Tax=Massilia sp. METH4 TaxID=3123041 RepID=UPI0030D50131